MDIVEREKLKQLANDAVIEYYGRDDLPARLAVALEKSIGEIEVMATECRQCSVCDLHGDKENEDIAVDGSEVLQVHENLIKRFAALGLIRDALAEDEQGDHADKLQDLLDNLKGDIDELEKLVIP